MAYGCERHRMKRCGRLTEKQSTTRNDLREFACELTSSWPPPRVEGRVWAALLGWDPPNPANPLSVPACVCFGATLLQLSLVCEIWHSGTMFFMCFSWTSQLKHLLLRAFLEDYLPEILLKVGVLAGRSMKKSNTSSDSSSGLRRL